MLARENVLSDLPGWIKPMDKAKRPVYFSQQEQAFENEGVFPEPEESF